jgi:hypothetical protein
LGRNYNKHCGEIKNFISDMKVEMLQGLIFGIDGNNKILQNQEQTKVLYILILFKIKAIKP